MSFEHGLVPEDSLRAAPGGYTLDLRLPWMRSLPFSSVTGIRPTVNGIPADPGAVTLRIRGDEAELDKLNAWWDRSWFIQERISLVVRSGPAVMEGEDADVAVAVDLSIPYILTGPGRPLAITQSSGRRLVAGGARPLAQVAS